MADLRQRLEALFTTHHSRYDSSQAWRENILDALVAMWPTTKQCDHYPVPCSGPPHPEGLRLLICENELNKLRIAHPQPSREELQRRLMEYWSWPRVIYTLSEDGIHCLGIDAQALDLLMGWARGEQEPKEWCSHISWREHEQKWVQIAIEPGGRVVPVGTWWDICPVTGCHAPRPT